MTFRPKGAGWMLSHPLSLISGHLRETQARLACAIAVGFGLAGPRSTHLGS